MTWNSVECEGQGSGQGLFYGLLRKEERLTFEFWVCVSPVSSDKLHHGLCGVELFLTVLTPPLIHVITMKNNNRMTIKGQTVGQRKEQILTHIHDSTHDLEDTFPTFESWVQRQLQKWCPQNFSGSTLRNLISNCWLLRGGEIIMLSHVATG